MLQSEYETFCLTLNACMVAAGRAKPDKAAADVFWMILVKFDLPVVQQALVECTDSIDHSYEYTVSLIRKKIESNLKVNKFREYAQSRIEQQEVAAIEQGKYLGSDEFDKNQASAKESFKACRELLND